jgi:acyl-coenzyme A synthetase/AMP-(fatty) acid ligase
VAEAAIFGIPDARLGEDAVAAVVVNLRLPPDHGVTALNLREWMLDRLAAHKVPRRIWFVDALPRTATGKVQRGELARRWNEDE